VLGVHSVEELCKVLKRPRKIILLVKAGKAVDDFIDAIIPHLEKGDIVIDGGNSHYPDTNRRTKELESKGFLFVGSGVSGGEEGARYGPSLSISDSFTYTFCHSHQCFFLVPGGSDDAWPHIKEIFQKTAAQSDGEVLMFLCPNFILVDAVFISRVATGCQSMLCQICSHREY